MARRVERGVAVEYQNRRWKSLWSKSRIVEGIEEKQKYDQKSRRKSRKVEWYKEEQNSMTVEGRVKEQRIVEGMRRRMARTVEGGVEEQNNRKKSRRVK